MLFWKPCFWPPRRVRTGGYQSLLTMGRRSARRIRKHLNLLFNSLTCLGTMCVGPQWGPLAVKRRCVSILQRL